MRFGGAGSLITAPHEKRLRAFSLRQPIFSAFIVMVRSPGLLCLDPLEVVFPAGFALGFVLSVGSRGAATVLTRKRPESGGAAISGRTPTS